MADGSTRMKRFSYTYRDLLVGLCLIAGTLAVYWQVGNYDFINFDDDLYVADNSYVKAGLTAESISWAFTSSDCANWHPLVWLSYMVGCEIYGPNPGWHHLTNVMFHLLNTILLFLILRRTTGKLWQCGFVAALFALHPLHVESVAWIAERKDVLSTLFWMMSLAGYAWYVERPRAVRYLLALGFFGLGLMSKPMLVTLPFVLLLLDYWPLGRFQAAQALQGSKTLRRSPLLRLVYEKFPFFVLAAASCMVTLVVQQKGGAVGSLTHYPFFVRISNALVSYVAYLAKMFWPYNLSVLYPHPGVLPWWQVAGAGLILVSVSFWALKTLKSHPYVSVGWLWYLGTLVPVIGLVQVGSQAMADRYTYVPFIGLSIIIAWGTPGLLKEWRYRGFVLALSAGLALLGLTACAWVQVGYWKNSITLFERSIQVTTNNFMAHNNLGNALAAQGKHNEAIRLYTEALRIKPHFVQAHNNLGLALEREGDINKATHHYVQALRLNPHYAEAHYNLGNALAHQGNFEEAVKHYFETLRIKPDFAEAHNNLGNVLLNQRKLKEAVSHYAEALRLEPDHARARQNLEEASAALTRIDKDIARTQKTLKRKPGNPALHCKLGNLWFSKGASDKAIAEYQKALAIAPESIQALYSLAMVYTVATKEYDKALPLLHKTITLRPDAVNAYYGIAHIYARQHKTEESIDWLRQAVERGFNNWELLKTDKGWESIRGSSSYQKLIQNH